MSELVRLFAENILPVIIVAGLGFFARRVLRLDPRPVTGVTFYIFWPALAFSLLYNTDIEVQGIFLMVAFSATVVLGMAAIGWLLARLLRLESGLTSALVLSIGFMNAGNFGLPVTQFAFGQEGLAWATVYFLTMSMLTNSLGAYVAAVGRQSARPALLGLLRVPAVYAIPVALLIRTAGWELPVAIVRPINLLAGATIPSMLIVLGMHTADIRLASRRALLALAAGTRLVASPLIALGVAAVYGLTGVARQAGVLEAGMPTAVLASILANRYDSDPDFVAGAVLLSTLLSPISLTVLLAVL
ncbi:MAG TPA: AEC family transporter [Anaerolineales bacterium]|nr:AEC family transporter [Anaerolineales bacterium]